MGDQAKPEGGADEVKKDGLELVWPYVYGCAIFLIIACF